MKPAIAAPVSRLGRLHWNQDYADIGMAVVLTAVAFGELTRSGQQLDVLGAILLALQTVPVAWRRRDPMRILITTGLAIIVYSGLGYPLSSGYLGVFVAFYTVAAHEPRRRAVVAAAVTALGILASFISYAVFGTDPTGTADMTATYLSFGLAWLIGDNLRVRRAYTRQLEQRAADLEREREERAALAVSQERARIARELHDVVAHHVSVMVVQASGARRVLENNPAAASDALAAVETAGRTALSEMRRMLEVLRTDEAGVGPQPGLGELERLAAQVREAGLPVELSVEGAPRELPGALDLAAYRIVQEALTNTVKHAGKASARVRVRYEPEALTLEVADDGRGAAAPLLAEGEEGAGHGLIGMRERVALYGGTLEAGPVFPGGYRVLASFPLDPVKESHSARRRGEDSALSAVAAAALRQRLDRGLRALPLAPEPEPLVEPRVVPPLIGRVVPPHPRPNPTRGRSSKPAAPKPAPKPAAPKPAAPKPAAPKPAAKPAAPKPAAPKSRKMAP
jgi:signal transduction histidine kinase